MTPSPEPQFVPVSRLYGSVSQLLRTASLVLGLLFVLRVLLSLFPLQTGALAVTLRFCNALVSQAPVAVLIVCLIGLSLLIDEEERSSRRLAHSLRSAALPVALCYLLLIPLYGTAQWWRFRSETTALRQGLQTSLQQLRSARHNVQRASSAEELRQIWERLPEGSPPLSRFGTTAGQQRSALMRFLDQVSGIVRARLAGAEQRLMVQLLRDTTLYALACLGLATLFFRSSQLGLPYRPRWSPALLLRKPPRRRRGRRGPLDDELETLVQADEEHGDARVAGDAAS